MPKTPKGRVPMRSTPRHFSIFPKSKKLFECVSAEKHRQIIALKRIACQKQKILADISSLPEPEQSERANQLAELITSEKHIRATLNRLGGKYGY